MLWWFCREFFCNCTGTPNCTFPLDSHSHAVYTAIMRIYYHISKYISHSTAGVAFIRALRANGVEVTTGESDATGCHAAIIHDDPMHLPILFAQRPDVAGLPFAAYAVWEGSELPASYTELLAPAAQVWTCSHFSQSLFLPHLPKTHVVPHIVTRPVPSAADVRFAREATGADDGAILFFSIIDGLNPRKNLEGLLAAFNALRTRVCVPVRLVVKQYRVTLPLEHIPGVRSLEGNLTPGQIGALHAISHAYVSAHHAEGWGLGLSEAMAFGKPVIATGYSGNMEFMDASNSIPLPYSMAPVSQRMCSLLPVFTPQMHWAEVDIRSMTDAMKLVVDKRLPAELCRNAAAITQRFSQELIGGHMLSLLQQFISP